MNSNGVGLFIGSIFLVIHEIKRNTRKKHELALQKIKEMEQRKMNPLLQERALFDQLFHEDEKKAVVNRNIVPELYNYETLEKMQLESEEENIWKQRILMQNTPHGNLVMFYDLYRQAFAYYADSHISYAVLNQCAMKYVRIYFCRDFFVDTTVLPTSFVNPFSKMKEEDEVRQKEKLANKRKERNLNFDTSAFVSKKKVVERGEVTNNNVYKNNFRCIGKLSGDWSMLKRDPILNHYDYIKKNNNPTSYTLWKSIALLAK